MERIRIWLALFSLAAVAACDGTAPAPLAPDAPATITAAARPADGPVVVQVGRLRVGSPFPPASGHDASFHARDAIRPRSIVIDAGSTVRFVVMPAHTAAIYEPGIEPEDIDLSTAAPPPFPFPPVIDDPDGRLERTPLNTNFATGEPIILEHTFTEPGRYLVICEVLPHFADGKMYAWVVVK